MQSSLRGIFQEDNSRRETLQGGNTSKSILAADASYQKMQNNLKNLQDKIRDLETKLTRVNDDDSSVLIDDVNTNRNIRGSQSIKNS